MGGGAWSQNRAHSRRSCKKRTDKGQAEKMRWHLYTRNTAYPWVSRSLHLPLFGQAPKKGRHPSFGGRLVFSRRADYVQNSERTHANPPAKLCLTNSKTEHIHGSRESCHVGIDSSRERRAVGGKTNSTATLAVQDPRLRTACVHSSIYPCRKADVPLVQG